MSLVKKILLFILLYFLYIPAVFFLLYYLSQVLPPIQPDWLGIVILAVLIGIPPVVFSVGFSMPSGKQRWLQQNGTLADAQILRVQDTGITVNNLSINLLLTLKVLPKGDQPFEIKLEGLFSRVGFPSEGDNVQVRFDPNDKTSVILSNS